MEQGEKDEVQNVLVQAARLSSAHVPSPQKGSSITCTAMP